LYSKSGKSITIQRFEDILADQFFALSHLDAKRSKTGCHYGLPSRDDQNGIAFFGSSF
jgi:hypothetical protein